MSRLRGILQVRGLDEIDPHCEYRVAGTDWGLQPEYEFPTMVRDVLEEAFAGRV